MRSAGSWILDERKFFTDGEQRKLRRLAARTRDARGTATSWNTWLFVELAFETGLRIGEASLLTCGDLRTSYRRPGVLVRHGKGGTQRYVRVSRRFCRSVAAFLEWKASAGEPTGPDAPLFRSAVTKGHLTVRALQKAFKRTCEEGGIEGHSPHHCRHTYASELYRSSGSNIRLVQKQLGHRRVTTTQIYADIFDPEMDVAVAELYDRPAKRLTPEGRPTFSCPLLCSCAASPTQQRPRTSSTRRPPGRGRRRR